ncbi:hypothetical protein EMQ25_13720 [Arsenicitalea aurantiaca]|uniref:Alpha 1,4-glycosyltransferase domain-containing protein n=1 Tax=Arsenicitalea aurantiaca TaxID=1783274 RepID=A0A433X8E6_9HYPH|nr:hypothetical protein [Arsenicitalea aurantiaca]RUT30361.1 hypothetical protein EMQ25_13720 [Arsenicitalea aurantiaca]
MSGLEPICSFWHGKLSFLEQVCIASFIAQGHSFTLYAYEDVGTLPAGCILADAAAIIPRENLFFYKGSRTPAVFADLFRLELMAREAGIWADCDVYCVRPFAGLGPYVFGTERAASWRNFWKAEINNAVFRCPPDSALLRAMQSVFLPGAVPPGLAPWRRGEVAIRRALREELPVHHMQFGATGPAPLNHYVRALGLIDHLSPKPVFYPLDYGRARDLLEPESTLTGAITEATLGVHMWHSALTDRGTGAMSPPHPDSFFGREMARLGIAD